MLNILFYLARKSPLLRDIEEKFTQTYRRGTFVGSQFYLVMITAVKPDRVHFTPARFFY